MYIPFDRGRPWLIIATVLHILFTIATVAMISEGGAADDASGTSNSADSEHAHSHDVFSVLRPTMLEVLLFETFHVVLDVLQLHRPHSSHVQVIPASVCFPHGIFTCCHGCLSLRSPMRLVYRCHKLFGVWDERRAVTLGG